VKAPVTRAVILAAGRGTRLLGELADRPKGFLTLGDKPIVEESIVRTIVPRLKAAGALGLVEYPISKIID